MPLLLSCCIWGLKRGSNCNLKSVSSSRFSASRSSSFFVLVPHIVLDQGSATPVFHMVAGACPDPSRPLYLIINSRLDYQGVRMLP
jgi:hypothetical protein